MSIIGIDPTKVSPPGSTKEFKLGTIVELVDRDGFSKIFQYATVTLSDGAAAFSVCLLSAGGSARQLSTSRAAAGAGDATRVGIAQGAMVTGASGWFQVYGNCRILCNGPTPANTKLYASASDGAVGNESTGALLVGLSTTSPKSSEGVSSVTGFINWANVTSTGDGLQGPPGDPGPPGEDGQDGAPGLSAYGLAVAEGYTGTITEWLASLQGPPGADGSPGGQSAYQIAVANGFEGTEAEWLDSLQGPPGPQGPAGPGGGGEDVLGIVWVDDHGTVGDGLSHPLSESYATLALAQVDYPLATSLTQEKDYCGFLNAMDQPLIGSGNALTIKMRPYKWYFFGYDSLQPTRKITLIGNGASANGIQVSKLGPVIPGPGVPGIRVSDSSAAGSIFRDFYVTSTGTGGRWRGGTIFEYNAAKGLMAMNDGTNSIEFKTFEARPVLDPRPEVIDAKFVTGEGAPFGTTSRVILVDGNPASFTPGEQLTVIRGGVPTTLATLTFCSAKISALITTSTLVDGVLGETITGATSGATATFLQKFNTAGLHTVEVSSVISTGGVGLDAGSYLTDPELRQIYCEEGTFAHGVEFNQFAIAEGISSSGFAGDGFKIASGADGRSGNSNRSRLYRCESVNNGGSGYTVAGSDGNVCSIIECNAVSNGGWGINDRSFLGSTFQACHMALNLTGGYRSSRNSTFIGCYVEGANKTFPHLEPENRISGDALALNGQTGIPMVMGKASGAHLTGRIIRHAHLNGEDSDTLNLGYNGDEWTGGKPSVVIKTGGVEFQQKTYSASDSGGGFRQVYKANYFFNAIDNAWYRNGSFARLTASGGNGKFHASYTVDGNGTITGVTVLAEGSSFSPQTATINIIDGLGSGAVLKPIVGPKGGIIMVLVVNGGSGYVGSRDWRVCLGFTAQGISVGAQWEGLDAELSTAGPDANHNLLIKPKGTGKLKFPVANVPNFADDAAAAAGGVPVGGIYRNGSVLMIRVS